MILEIAYMSDSSSSTDRMTAAFVSMFIEQTAAKEDESESCDTSPGGEDKKQEGVTKVLKTPSVDKCLKWLEQLNVEENALESE